MHATQWQSLSFTLLASVDTNEVKYSIAYSYPTSLHLSLSLYVTEYIVHISVCNLNMQFDSQIMKTLNHVIIFLVYFHLIN